MWCAELEFGGQWIRLPLRSDRRGDLEWAIGIWKEKNRMTSDPFRYVQEEVPCQSDKIADVAQDATATPTGATH